MKYYLFSFSFQLLIISNIQTIITSTCNSISSCIECFLSNCTYDQQYKCIPPSESLQKDLISQINKCENIHNTNEYCNNIGKTSIPLNATIQKNINLTNNEILFCVWKLNNIDSSKQILINFNNKDVFNISKYLLQITYINNTQEQIFLSNIDSNKISMIFNQIHKVNFLFYSRKTYDFNGFELEIDYRPTKSKKNNKAIMIVSSVIVSTIFIIIIVSIILVCVCRSKYEIELEQNAHNGKDRNDNKTKELFKQLKHVSYDKAINKFESNCTICLEIFKEKEKVFQLTCGHIFHEKCLKVFLLQKHSGNNYKCPNCNSNIFEEYLPTDKKTTSNQNNTILILQNNISRRMIQHVTDISMFNSIISNREIIQNGLNVN